VTRVNPLGEPIVAVLYDGVKKYLVMLAQLLSRLMVAVFFDHELMGSQV
jgi:hypothetical protein